MDRNVYRFETLTLAAHYAMTKCNGIDEYCIIVDTKEDKIVGKMSF